MLVKICGITNINEVNALNELKPEYMGLVFTESKRKVSIEKANSLLSNLNKDIKSVGVFRNNSIGYILDVVKNTPIDIIQLHGYEDNEFIEELKKKTSCEIWKAVSITSKEDLVKALNYKVDTLLLDGSNPGSGKVFPWEYLEDIDINKRIFLAGGINENNVLEAIEKVKPYGIDTSSGVEFVNEDGVRSKSKEKIKRLINKVRENNEG